MVKYCLPFLFPFFWAVSFSVGATDAGSKNPMNQAVPAACVKKDAEGKESVDRECVRRHEEKAKKAAPMQVPGSGASSPSPY